MGTIATMVINLIANTSQFDRGIKGARNTLKGLQASGDIVTSGMASMAIGFGVAAGSSRMITRSIDLITESHKRFREGNKDVADYINLWAEAVPVLGRVSIAVREASAEFSGLNAATEFSKKIDDYLENSKKLETKLQRNLQMGKASSIDRKNLQSLYEYQDTLDKINENEKLRQKLISHNLEIDRQIRDIQKGKIAAEKELSKSSYWWNEDYKSLLQERVSNANENILFKQGEKSIIPNDLTRFSKLAKDAYDFSLNLNKSQDSLAKIKKELDDFGKTDFELFVDKIRGSGSTASLWEINSVYQQKLKNEEMLKQLDLIKQINLQISGLQTQKELFGLPDFQRIPLELYKQAGNMGLDPAKLAEVNGQISDLANLLDQIEKKKVFAEKQKELKAYADSIKELIKTPLETFGEKVHKLNEIWKKGMISNEQWYAAFDIYKKDYESSIKKSQTPGGSARVIDYISQISVTSLQRGGGQDNLEELNRKQLEENKEQTKHLRNLDRTWNN
jgi:hypothetical protein